MSGARHVFGTLQVVDDGDHRAGVDVEDLAEFALGQAGALVDGHQRGVVAAAQTQLLQRAVEAADRAPSSAGDVDGVSTKVNYGLNKVRFPAPVPAGARIRAGGTLTDVQEVTGNGVQLTADVRIDIDGGDKTACIAQPVFRFYR